MKAFQTIPLLLAFSACASALTISPASTILEKRAPRGGGRGGGSHGSGSASVYSSCEADGNSCNHGEFSASYTSNWPKPLAPDFFHTGGSRVSFIAKPKPKYRRPASGHFPYFERGFEPKELNASSAAALYPGTWPESVYAFNMTFESVEGSGEFDRVVDCLCEVSRECGCGPDAWINVEGFYARKNVKKVTERLWVVNGTATVEDLGKEQKLEDQKLEDQRLEDQKRKERDASRVLVTDGFIRSAAPRWGPADSWAILGLLVATVVF